MTSSPGSSVGRAPSEPQGETGRHAGSSPARGSPYLYGIVRKELSGGPQRIQFGHAITECLRPEDLPLPKDTRLVMLMATKEQLIGVETLLLKDGIHHAAVLETDGPLAGVITAIGLLTHDKESLKPILGELRPWREPK